MPAVKIIMWVIWGADRELGFLSPAITQRSEHKHECNEKPNRDAHGESERDMASVSLT